jgi:hypothetical protein
MRLEVHDMGDGHLGDSELRSERWLCGLLRGVAPTDFAHVFLGEDMAPPSLPQLLTQLSRVHNPYFTALYWKWHWKALQNM